MNRITIPPRFEDSLVRSARFDCITTVPFASCRQDKNDDLRSYQSAKCTTFVKRPAWGGNFPDRHVDTRERWLFRTGQPGASEWTYSGNQHTAKLRHWHRLRADWLKDPGWVLGPNTRDGRTVQNKHADTAFSEEGVPTSARSLAGSACHVAQHRGYVQ